MSKSKSKFGFGKIKDFAGRKVHQVKAKMGKATKTIDIQFDSEYKRFEDFQGVVKSTQKHLNDFCKAVTNLSVAETNLVECWQAIFDTSDPCFNAAGKATQVTGTSENIRMQLVEDLKRDMDEPLDLYQEQFKEIKKRSAERTNRLTDMDRFKDEYERLQRAGKDAEKVESLNVQYHAMEYYYEKLNNELKRDIPLMIDDRAIFYTPLFGQWIFHLHEYYRQVHESIAPIEGAVSSIDTSNLGSHAFIITPEETSAHTMNIDAGLVGDIDEDLAGGHKASAPPPAVSRAPPPRPGANVQTLRALYDFTGQDSSELSFSEGDIITLISDDGEWLQGELKGRRGLLPANYVERM